MSRDCRYICQRAANAIISEVGSYRVSTDALHGINQFLDEFLVQLLVDCQSLDLSRIKASIFNLLPSTLGKNAIVEAELEVKTFTETEMVDYTVYEKMRTLGQQQQQQQPCFPTKTCLALLRDKCLEFCTLADKDDQQSWLPQKECNDVIISPIVAVYVTTVLEHMAEYILTAVAMTAETEDTDYVRIKELFLALVDDIQVGVVFQTMDLRDKMEKRSFAHGYLPRSSIRPSSTPIRKQQVRYSTSSMNRSGSSSRGLTFDESDLHYHDDDDTSSPNPPSGFAAHTSFSNYSVLPNNISRPTSAMPNNTSSNAHRASSKRAYKVFNNDHHSSNMPISELDSFSVYDPDAPTMNFEDLIRSGNTMRVSLTPNRLKSIETKNQMADDPVPSKFAWKRRSVSVPRRSTTGSRPQTPTPARLPQCLQSPLVKSGSVLSKKGRKGSTKAKSRKNDTRPDNHQSLHDPAEPHHLSDASSLSSYSSSTNKHFGKSLPTPTSSTSSRKSKKRLPVPSEMELPSSPSIASSIKSNSTRATLDSTSLTSAASSISLSSTSSSLLGLATSVTPVNRSSSIRQATQPATLSPTPTLRRSSLSSRKSRENIRRQKGKSDQPTTRTSPVENDTVQLKSSQIQQRERSASVPVKPNSLIPCSPPPSASSLLSQQHTKESGGSLERSISISIIDTKPERPSSYVAKRASATGSSHPPTPYESYAINQAKECEAQNEQLPVSTRPLSTAGTVGNTIKQLDQMMAANQRSSSPSLPNIDIIKAAADTPPSPPTTIRSRSRQFSSPLSCTSSSQQNATTTTTFRRSMVLDKVLLFERAHSMDDHDIANRRASSYIPRRDRLMYLQKDLHALERPRTATVFTPDNTIPIVRPGTSAAIAAAAARFAAGVSMAIQTDTKATTATTPTSSTVDGDNNNNNNNGQEGDMLSEHGVVVGDEEWFLHDDEWEDAQEQEHAVVDWLLGEAC